METLVLVIHVIAALGVISLVLMQHGKGADMGATFGSGASGSLFGVSGSSNFLSRATAIFVAIFFVTSLTLAYLSSHRAEKTSVINLQTNSVTTTQEKSDKVAEQPAAPATAKEVPQ